MRRSTSSFDPLNWAINQLGSDKPIRRIAAVYELMKLADEDPDGDGERVHNMFTAMAKLPNPPWDCDASLTRQVTAWLDTKTNDDTTQRDSQ